MGLNEKQPKLISNLTVIVILMIACAVIYFAFFNPSQKPMNMVNTPPAKQQGYNYSPNRHRRF